MQVQQFFNRTAVVFALLIGASSSAWASAQEALTSFVKDRGFAEGQFSQVVISPTGAIKQRGTGEFTFSRPGKFRWEIKKPYPLLLLSNGTNVVSYDEDMGHATEKPIGNAMDSTPVALLFGSKNVDKLFDLKDEGMTDGKEWLVIKPKDKDNLFDYARIGWKDGLPVSLEIHDALGQVTQLELTNWDFSKQRPAAYFDFKAPAGVDLIRAQ
ncbi:outer membrane lipoprotein chaperone LolA [Limnobacter parvus]|uniref:Outer-membrane lipoprotein carrier protein n=1 Tax=Limnobacter parvus TaxID=2939690 RepID=A0ABT1XL40_9BURK|nr:outer membrane lipoprotein chaperone LolA [Limnobacter parvus]MCR2747002.1 outer membrane lipoprotein chaperone LolA [Limnobacter parvus]